MYTLEEISAQADAAVEAFFEVVKPLKGQIAVVGCSTSEVGGEKIGSCSSAEIAEAVYAALDRHIIKNGVFLAAQCCEHLNRALIVERECAEKYGLEIVNVVPALKAGGAMATAAYSHFSDPVAVERISAHAGLDIGDTLIGMHLRSVAVPVRTEYRSIGGANLVMARTRPKYIGGPRAHYE